MNVKIRQREDAFDAQRAHGQFPSRPSPGLLSAAHRWSETVWSTAEQAGPVPLQDKELRLGLALAKRPVFICGAHRSGTTLVRDLLDGHPALSVLPSEGSFLTNLQAKLALLPPAEQRDFFGQEWLRRLANPNNRPPFWLLGRTTADSSPYVLFARRLIAWWDVAQHSFATCHSLWPLMALALAYTSETSHQGAGPPIQHWVEKTPTNEFYLARLLNEFPVAKCIHIVRNPLAVYASRQRAEERSLGIFLAARQALQEMAQSFQIAVEQSAHGRQSAYVMIRYEDLLAAPQHVTKRLATFLEIEPSPSLLRPTVMNIPVAPNSSFQSHQQAGHIIPVDTACQDNGVDGLTQPEQAFVAAYAGEFAAQLGYPLHSLTPTQQLLRKCQLSLWYLYSHIRFRFFR